MELDNKKLTIIIVIMTVFMIIHFTFTIWSYIQLRNRRGPPGPKGPRGPRGFPGQ
tara:strand:- start:408 stop:572 length:165 start_codon:yes stop_codon:yes gene_type:complete